MAPPIKSSKLGQDESDASSNNLWVGNLAPDVTDVDLMDLFAKFGAIDSVNTYSSRSYAFVYFKRAEDAAAAKDSLQGTVVRGSPLKIEFARPAKPSKHLWVGGFGSSVSKEQLEEEFIKFGKVEDFKFLRERSTAFIEFANLEDAVEAMRKLNGKRVGVDHIRVDFLRSHSRREPDFRDTRDGHFPITHSGLRRSQPSAARRDVPSNILWVGYPPSLQIDEQMLHNAMILFGEIERIKSFPSRHYSFVEFRSVDEARRAKEGLQGRLFNDPRITIMYSSSELGPKEYSSFQSGPRPEIFNEHPFPSSQLEMLDHHRPVGVHSFPGSFPPSSIQRPNVQLRPFGPQGGFDPLSASDFHDLPAMHNLRDGNSNIPMGPNWNRPSPPASGILPSPTSRVRPPMRSVSTGWDVLDPNQHQRESKRSRIDVPSAIDDDSFPGRAIDDRGLLLDKTYRLGMDTDAGIPSSHLNIHGKRSLSPVGTRSGHLDNDFIWRGTIAKGGTPVCHARCVPIDKGIESELPEVVNCSARTGLDMLAKHYAEAIGFDIVFFLPDSEEDFASYTEFLRYLGSKNRAGVAKFDDGTTLFLVPPSDFLTNVLKVAGPERLYGVVLKLPQQVPSGASVQPQIRQPNHFAQYADRHHIPPPDADYNQIVRKEEHVLPVDYNRVLHEESKPPSKPYYPPTTDSVMDQSVPQDYASSNTTAVSQAGVSLTPELIATLASLLPANAQSTALEGGQPISGSPAIRPPLDKRTSSNGWKNDNQVPGNANHLQYGSQYNPPQEQVPSQFQHYSSLSNGPNHLANMVPGSTQIQDSSVNLPHQAGIAPRPLSGVTMPSQSGQVPLSPQVGQPYPLEASQQKSYSGMVHGTDIPGSYSPSVISNNPAAFSNQVQGVNYSQAQAGMPLSADKVNWEVPNQVSQFQNLLPGSGQGTSEDVVDKNQRYQSTLQFAANLLQQIQQQQQQQTGSPAIRGPGNQQ